MRYVECLHKLLINMTFEFNVICIGMEQQLTRASDQIELAIEGGSSVSGHSSIS